jgi:hypothetical protein
MYALKAGSPNGEDAPARMQKSGHGPAISYESGSGADAMNWVSGPAGYPEFLLFGSNKSGYSL